MSILKMLSESSGAGLRRVAGGVNLRARTQGLAGRYFQEQNVPGWDERKEVQAFQRGRHSLITSPPCLRTVRNLSASRGLVKV